MERETSRSVLSPAWRQAVGGEEGGREGGRESRGKGVILERKEGGRKGGREGCGG